MAHEIPGMPGVSYIISNAESHGGAHLDARRAHLAHWGGWVTVPREVTPNNPRTEETQAIELFFPRETPYVAACDALRDHLGATYVALVGIPYPMPPSEIPTAPAAA